MAKEKGQARLRLVKSDDFDLCSSYRATAESPLGSTVRPCSMSLTVEGASPMSVPISASVSPVDRRSEMREAHVVMPNSIRESVLYSQRLPVTVVRKNVAMPRPKEMPPDLDTVGKRVRWWREHRGVERKAFAKQCGMSPTALSDLELDRTKKGTNLHIIAARLRLNAHYLETGKGEPEAEFAQDAPPEPFQWPFEGIPRTKLERLNRIERAYAETRLQEALLEIEAERRRAKKTGS